ncbi:ALI_collapsed_G0050420.mRNA.1.CDS.1 [Saccharomyces cerevisiae]|nr:ALI_collapsed_G0050420.mRNA.1.CDS.1 [Saccharomyces cerevisiae]
MKKNSSVVFFLVGLSQFVTMAFLIIGSITAPIFKQIGYSKYDEITYGTFGYCKEGSCSKASYNYQPDELSESDSNWKLNSNARSILGKIIFITPIAAGLNFLGFLCTIMSVLLINVLSSDRVGSASAIMFFVNLTFSTLGFLSASLICIVVFLLFYPHVTWCSWVLIPGAALSLLVIPLIFSAYSRSSGSRDDDETEELEEKGMLLNDPYLSSKSGRFDIDADSEANLRGDSRTNLLGDNFKNGTNITVVPDIISHNQDPKLSNITTSTTSDISTFDKEAKDMENSNGSGFNEEEDDGMAYDKRRSTSTYSVIESESGLKNGSVSNNYVRNNGNNTSNNINYKVPLGKTEISSSASLASSDYSQREVIPHRNPSRLLNDIMETSFNEPNDSHINSMSSYNDKDSTLTSISQRGVNPEVYNQMPRETAAGPANIRPYAGQPHPAPLVYPQQRLQPQQRQPQQQYHQYNLYQKLLLIVQILLILFYKAILISTLPQTKCHSTEIRYLASVLLRILYQTKAR